MSHVRFGAIKWWDPCMWLFIVCFSFTYIGCSCELGHYAFSMAILVLQMVEHTNVVYYLFTCLWSSCVLEHCKFLVAHSKSNAHLTSDAHGTMQIHQNCEPQLLSCVMFGAILMLIEWWKLGSNLMDVILCLVLFAYVGSKHNWAILPSQCHI